MSRNRRPGYASILAVLRAELRLHGVRVPALAGKLGVAEPTVWRWLRGEGLTLEALDRICAHLDLDLRDLLAKADDGAAEQFTLPQERILAADRGLALLFFALLNGADRQQCERDFGLSSDRVDHYLARLERLGLIDIKTGSRIRPLTRRTVRWRKGGPLASAFERTVKHLFLAMDFGGADARYVSDMVRISAAGRARVQALFEALRADIHMIAQQEQAARLDHYDWSAVMMFVRPVDLDDLRQGL